MGVARAPRGSGSAATPPRVWHVSAIPEWVPGRDAMVATLNVVARDFAPLAATFFTVGGTGEIASAAVHGSHLPPAEMAREVHGWLVRLHGIDPLAPRKIAGLSARVATLHDVGGTRRAVLEQPPVQSAYRQLGVINDVRLVIRDSGRLVAGVTLWRSCGRMSSWSTRQLRLLAALQPLIEMAYVAAVHSSSLDTRLPATLTPRQRQVARLLAGGATNAEIARALHVSDNTAKSHTRAVLAKLGVASRRAFIVQVSSKRTGDSG